MIIKINSYKFCEITSFVLTEYRYLQHFDIDALVLNSASSLMCARVYEPLESGETRRIPCRDEVAGNVVRITQLSTVPTILSLCEVKVYGEYRRAGHLSLTVL